jgi:mycoredoxin
MIRCWTFQTLYIDAVNQLQGRGNGMTDRIIVYGHPGCPMVGPVRNMLDKAGADFEYINIHQDEAAREHVRAINSGNESVPTLVFPDGTTLIEPSVGELQQHLAGLGYSIPLTAQLIARWPQILIAAGVLLALLRVLGVF